MLTKKPDPNLPLSLKYILLLIKNKLANLDEEIGFEILRFRNLKLDF